MADVADRAGDLIDEHLAAALAARKVMHGPSEEFCIECGDDIPEQRRALGGVTRCVHCQDAHERRGGRRQ